MFPTVEARWFYPGPHPPTCWPAITTANTLRRPNRRASTITCASRITMISASNFALAGSRSSSARNNMVCSHCTNTFTLWSKVGASGASTSATLTMERVIRATHPPHGLPSAKRADCAATGWQTTETLSPSAGWSMPRKGAISSWQKSPSTSKAGGVWRSRRSARQRSCPRPSCVSPNTPCVLQRRPACSYGYAQWMKQALERSNIPTTL